MNPEDLALFDANILVYARNEASEFHKRAGILRTQALHGEIHACVTPQVLWEFFAIVTDGKRIENPLSVSEVIHEIQNYLRCETIFKVYPTAETPITIMSLITNYEIIGQHIHDTCLVATMLDNGIRTLYSGDETMRKYKEIIVINPFTS